MNTSSFRRRSLLLSLLFVVGLSGLSWRLINIQVIQANNYADKANRISIRKEILKASRGYIVDTNDQLIARNISRATIGLDKKLIKDVGLAAIALAHKELSETAKWNQWDSKVKNRKIKMRASSLKEEMNPHEIIDQYIEYVINVFSRPLGMTRAELRKKMRLDSKRMYEVIKQDVSEDNAFNLKELARKHSILHAFIFEETQKRWYVMPEMAAHIIGFTGKNKKEKSDVEKGRSGIEKYMNQYLEGHDGYIKNHRDKYNLLAVAKPQEVKTPRHGLNLKLTLDMGLQAILQEELKAGIEEFEAKKGTVILIDPKTGALLAMASFPSFNLNTRKNVVKNGFDFATQAIYEPGSTFKVIAASGALDQGLVTPKTEIFCHYAHFVNGSVIVPDHHPYGNLTVEQILAKSSNIGAYKLALLLGRNKYFNYLNAFGFGKKTNIDLAGESAGFVRNTGNPTDFSRIAYGYGVSVTPLQVACAYAAIANGGLLMRPQLVKSILANDGTIVKSFESEVIRRVMKKSTAKKMRAALATVVDVKGTARRAKVEGYIAAGKTGTSHKSHPGGGYYNGRNGRETRYVASFVGMLPAADPAFVCVVVIDDPRTKKIPRGGGTIAAPIFSKVATRVARQMGIETTEPIKHKNTLSFTHTTL